MSLLQIKSETEWDLASLGEVMLRFDPGEERIHNTRNFRVWEGGGEYNVARGLSKVFQKENHDHHVFGQKFARRFGGRFDNAGRS